MTFPPALDPVFAARRCVQENDRGNALLGASRPAVVDAAADRSLSCLPAGPCWLQRGRSGDVDESDSAGARPSAGGCPAGALQVATTTGLLLTAMPRVAPSHHASYGPGRCGRAAGRPGFPEEGAPWATRGNGRQPRTARRRSD